MIIGNLVYSYMELFAIGTLIIGISVAVYFYSKNLITLSYLGLIVYFVILMVGSICGNYYDANVSSSMKDAEKTLVSSKYAVVKQYKVKAYLLTDNKEHAEVILTNGKKFENVNVKRINKLANENKTKVSFYDINLKKKYRPINNKNEFNRQTLVIEKKIKGSQVK